MSVAEDDQWQAAGAHVTALSTALADVKAPDDVAPGPVTLRVHNQWIETQRDSPECMRCEHLEHAAPCVGFASAPKIVLCWDCLAKIVSDLAQEEFGKHCSGCGRVAEIGWGLLSQDAWTMVYGLCADCRAEDNAAH